MYRRHDNFDVSCIVSRGSIDTVSRGKGVTKLARRPEGKDGYAKVLLETGCWSVFQ